MDNFIEMNDECGKERSLWGLFSFLPEGGGIWRNV